jgi:hypothetical protein
MAGIRSGKGGEKEVLVCWIHLSTVPLHHLNNDLHWRLLENITVPADVTVRQTKFAHLLNQGPSAKRINHGSRSRNLSTGIWQPQPVHLSLQGPIRYATQD